jgi:hypothetical protein
VFTSIIYQLEIVEVPVSGMWQLVFYWRGGGGIFASGWLGDFTPPRPVKMIQPATGDHSCNGGYSTAALH